MKKPRTSITRKLVTVIMVTSTTVLVLAGAVFIAHDVTAFRASLVSALETRAAILAANSTAALAFENKDDARQVLTALENDPHMRLGVLYDQAGHVFSTYPASATASDLPTSPEQGVVRFERSSLTVLQPVAEHGRRLGTLYLSSDLGTLEEQVRVDLLVMLLAILGSIGVAFALSTWLQRGIAGPVLSLAGVATRVSDDKDYSMRAPAAGDDEVGLLTDAFNDMLSEIQRRDMAVQSSEARLRAILESALDCIITMDHEGRVVEFNPAAEVLFGYDRQRAIGANLGELIVPPAQRAKHAQGLARYIATEKAVMLGKRLEMGAMRADGRELTVELSITRIPHDGPPLFTGFIRDITERKHAEAEVRQLNQDLERRVGERTAELETSNKELEAFSYSVSHDLRSPLRAIDGFSKSVVEECGDALSERGRRDLDRVRAAARQMGMLIDDLLDLARLSRAEMHRQRVDLTAIGEGVAAALRQAEPERAATIVIAEGLVTEGDSQLLRVVLDNLLRNAWKFTARHPTARIEVGCTGDNGTRQYFVRDDGAGFDMAHADLLFQPFKRLHRQTDFEGTGIGLATVQRIIQRHGGRIWAESAVEHGATFYFTLGERPRR